MWGVLAPKNSVRETYRTRINIKPRQLSSGKEWARGCAPFLGSHGVFVLRLLQGSLRLREALWNLSHFQGSLCMGCFCWGAYPRIQGMPAPSHLPSHMPKPALFGRRAKLRTKKETCAPGTIHKSTKQQREKRPAQEQKCGNEALTNPPFLRQESPGDELSTYSTMLTPSPPLSDRGDSTEFTSLFTWKPCPGRL